MTGAAFTCIGNSSVSYLKPGYLDQPFLFSTLIARTFELLVVPASGSIKTGFTSVE